MNKNETFGAYLKDLREKAGFTTRRAAAEKVGIHETTISTLERGSTNLTDNAAQRVATAYGVMVEDILRKRPEPTDRRRTRSVMAVTKTKTMVWARRGRKAGSRNVDRTKTPTYDCVGNTIQTSGNSAVEFFIHDRFFTSQPANGKEPYTRTIQGTNANGDATELVFQKKSETVEFVDENTPTKKYRYDWVESRPL